IAGRLHCTADAGGAPKTPLSKDLRIGYEPAWRRFLVFDPVGISARLLYCIYLQSAENSHGRSSCMRTAGAQPARIGRSDHRVGRTPERGQLSMAVTDRGVRSTSGLVGRLDTVVCALA